MRECLEVSSLHAEFRRDRDGKIDGDMNTDVQTSCLQLEWQRDT